ncbi:sporulation integral membrane protein YtvI [Sporolactobacillus sp. Y61]|uniref:Sporulation integral membrane protein YtvI n=1 Tax=Sporolactobacillus sp. Y61 TaxID=3160863 RepID=A0AAU8IF30_9BACL
MKAGEKSIKIYLSIALRALFVLALVVLILFFTYLTVRFAFPFLIACLLSLLLNPLVSLLEKKTGIPRGLSAFVVLFLLFSAVIGLMLFAAVSLIKGITVLSKTVPGHLDALIGDLQNLFFSRLVPAWERAVHLFSGLSPGQQQALRLNIESMTGTLVDFLNDSAGRLVISLTHFISSLPDTLLSALFVFLAAFFISKDTDKIRQRLSLISLPAIQTPALQVWKDLKQTCAGFIRAQFILVTITFLLIYFGLLCIGVSHPFTIAVIAGSVDLIPYLGTGVIFIPWILYHMIIQNYPLALTLSALYLTVVIQRQLLEPKILSATIGIDPLASLVALYFGFRWLGFSGLVIGPVLLIVVRSLYHSGVLKDTWAFIIGRKT